MATAVWGLGRSGQAAAKLLQARGETVTVYDQADTEALRAHAKALSEQGIAVVLGEFGSAEQIVVSPGISWQHPQLQESRSRGCVVIGEAELAWQVLKALPWVAITGTNGKTTTTALVTAIWHAHGWHAPACGNIGLPLSAVALEAITTGVFPDWIVAELSSYQIEAAPSIAPTLGLWTTFTPDHLERHGSLAHYAAIKASLLKRSRTAILNAQDPYLASQQAQWPQALWCGEGDVSLAAGHLYVAGQAILPLSEYQLLGQHNQHNLMLAVAAACRAEIPAVTIRHAVQSFKAPPHRLETICKRDGVYYVNDSKATNYDAAEVGLRAITTPVVLIAGGQAKQGDDQAWLAQIKARCSHVILIGAAANQFAARLTDIGYNRVQIVPSLTEAVPLAATLAVPGSTVLLSPACASFDHYANYEERGEHFRRCCLAL